MQLTTSHSIYCTSMALHTAHTTPRTAHGMASHQLTHRTTTTCCCSRWCSRPHIQSTTYRHTARGITTATCYHGNQLLTAPVHMIAYITTAHIAHAIRTVQHITRMHTQLMASTPHTYWRLHIRIHMQLLLTAMDIHMCTSLHALRTDADDEHIAHHAIIHTEHHYIHIHIHHIHPLADTSLHFRPADSYYYIYSIHTIRSYPHYIAWQYIPPATTCSTDATTAYWWCCCRCTYRHMHTTPHHHIQLHAITHTTTCCCWHIHTMMP